MSAIEVMPVTRVFARRGDCPAAYLLDARAAGLDPLGLQAWARAETTASDAEHVARSYRYPYALVAWHSEPVGVDIERIERCTAEFGESIRTPAERSDADPLNQSDDEYLTSLWSSKEALSKALGDAVRYDPQRLGSPMLWPSGEAGPWRASRLEVPEGHIAWLCWRSARGSAQG